MERIKLFTCIGLNYDLGLLKHQIEHYLGLGILPENYLLVLNIRDEDDPLLDYAYGICCIYDIIPIHIWVGEYTSQNMYRLRTKIISENLAPDEWLIHADADEFHWYPQPLDQMIAECRKNGWDAIQGVFTDRITADGNLAVVQEEEKIYDQFPVLANLNNVWFDIKSNPASGVVKMMAYKHGLVTTRGGHQIINRKANYAFGMDLTHHKKVLDTSFRESCPYQVHHFKWHSEIIPKLKRRVNTYKQAGYSWWRTSQQFIDAVNADKIPLELVELYEDQSKASPLF